MIDHTKFVDEIVVRLELKRAIESAGSQQAFAQQHGFDAWRIANWLGGMRAPSDKLLSVLGFERCPTLYRRIEKKDAA